MTLELPETITFTLDAACPGETRSEISVRQHRVTVDEPEPLGTDTAPTPLETYLTGYLACTNVILHMIAAEKKIVVDRLSLSLNAHLDTAGIATTTPTRLPFPAMELGLTLRTQASDAAIDTLRSELAQRCPVSVMLRAAGTQITETWTVER